MAVASDGAVVAHTKNTIARWRNGAWTRDTSAFSRRGPSLAGPGAPALARQTATARDGRQAAATADGLFLKGTSGKWERQFPKSGRRSWSPDDVRGVAFDSRDRLWFASPQGVGVFEAGTWTLYTGAEGLPYDDFTAVTAGERRRRLVRHAHRRDPLRRQARGSTARARAGCPPTTSAPSPSTPERRRLVRHREGRRPNRAARHDARREGALLRGRNRQAPPPHAVRVRRSRSD